MSSEGSRNWYGIEDPELDGMLEEQLTLLDTEERGDKVREIQRYALEELLNPIPVWTYLAQVSYSPELQNYYHHASYGYSGLTRAWLDSDS